MSERLLFIVWFVAGLLTIAVNAQGVAIAMRAVRALWLATVLAVVGCMPIVHDDAKGAPYLYSDAGKANVQVVHGTCEIPIAGDGYIGIEGLDNQEWASVYRDAAECFGVDIPAGMRIWEDGSTDMLCIPMAICNRSIGEVSGKGPD